MRSRTLIAALMLLASPGAAAETPEETSEGSEPGDAVPEAAAEVTPEVAAAREAYDRRIAGMLRFFWDNEVEGASLSGLPVGRHTVEVQITLASDGTVEDVRVGASSGVESIDALALRAVRGASPLPEPRCCPSTSPSPPATKSPSLVTSR